MNSCQTTDFTGNGLPDVIITGMGSNPTLSLGEKTIWLRQLPGIRSITPQLETNIVWYENPGWERHTLAAEPDLHPGVGSTLYDVAGDDQVDLIVGQGYQHSDLYWYRQPSDSRDPWEQHLITDRFQKYHDLTIGDVDNDGQPELTGLTQEAESLFCYGIPDDPFVEMWPNSACTIVDDAILLRDFVSVISMAMETVRSSPELLSITSTTESGSESSTQKGGTMFASPSLISMVMEPTKSSSAKGIPQPTERILDVLLGSIH